MRAAVLLLFVACLGLALFAYRQDTALKLQREEIQHLVAKMDSMSKTSMMLDLQERCSRQARQQFKLYGFRSGDMAGFTDHYNANLNKCFIHVRFTDAHTVRGTITNSQNLADAFEGKEYGTYIWSTQKGKKYWEVPPLECDVTLPSGEKKICHSSEEFDELVKQYLE